eukprot:TRINITY_DN485_c0_g1_i1.p1 TRINITY_DN485_c0_g1~~TRINITY_DN485_c0_g1_i1.p1  ORF type:complete len:330 (+),score=139.92 TRINITY_DN485_c0_g1_i1:228-1217(+)
MSQETAAGGAATAERVAQLSAWDYAVLKEGRDPAADFLHMALGLDATRELGVTEGQVRALLHEAQGLYHQHPYHCFVHAVDVAQVVFAFLVRGNARAHLSATEQLALLVAALCHDLDHPGFTNEFALLSGHPLAREAGEHNNVLERHHVALSHRVLEGPSVDFLRSLSPEQRQLFLDTLDYSIGATFMGDHQKYLTDFVQLIGENEHKHSSPKFRRQLCALILKAADIFNQARPFEVAAVWSKRFQEETWQEGDMRKERGIDMGMFMDRKDPVRLSTMQSGFITYFVQPLLMELVAVLPDVSPALDELNRTRARWESITAQDAAGQAQV